MGSDLKPCPFCAHAPQLDAARRKDAETWWVECHNCSSGGPSLPSEREALTAWNDVSTATARAEAAEQRAEALAAEVARLRADALLILGRYRGIDDCFDGEDRLMLGDDECEALDALSEAAFFSTDDVAAAIGRVLAAAQPAGEVSDG